MLRGRPAFAPFRQLPGQLHRRRGKHRGAADLSTRALVILQGRAGLAHATTHRHRSPVLK
eukprot:2605947-Lingulodinium_polyedra.AAC.1